MSDSEQDNDYGSFSDGSGGDLGSDFGEQVCEYELDKHGNPIGAQGKVVESGDPKRKADERPDEDPEARKKRKRLEKLDRKIKGLAKDNLKKGKVVMTTPADIKNKQKRQEIVLKKKMADAREKKLEHLKQVRIREEHGEAAAPKGKTNTIESMRVKDETIITEIDDDIKGEHEVDEFAKYFNKETKPRILMTTNRRPKGKVFDFMKEIDSCIPNIEYWPRKNIAVQEMIKQANERGDFTDLMLWYEKNGKPHSLILCHLPKGPTATFRVSGLKLRK
jgi:ribosome production factor 1